MVRLNIFNSGLTPDINILTFADKDGDNLSERIGVFDKSWKEILKRSNIPDIDVVALYRAGEYIAKHHLDTETTYKKLSSVFWKLARREKLTWTERVDLSWLQNVDSLLPDLSEQVKELQEAEIPFNPIPIIAELQAGRLEPTDTLEAVVNDYSDNNLLNRGNLTEEYAPTLRRIQAQGLWSPVARRWHAEHDAEVAAKYVSMIRERYFPVLKSEQIPAINQLIAKNADLPVPIPPSLERDLSRYLKYFEECGGPCTFQELYKNITLLAMALTTMTEHFNAHTISTRETLPNSEPDYRELQQQARSILHTLNRTARTELPHVYALLSRQERQRYHVN